MFMHFNFHISSYSHRGDLVSGFSEISPIFTFTTSETFQFSVKSLPQVVNCWIRWILTWIFNMKCSKFIACKTQNSVTIFNWMFRKYFEVDWSFVESNDPIVFISESHCNHNLWSDLIVSSPIMITDTDSSPPPPTEIKHSSAPPTLIVLMTIVESTQWS